MDIPIFAFAFAVRFSIQPKKNTLLDYEHKLNVIAHSSLGICLFFRIQINYNIKFHHQKNRQIDSVVSERWHNNNEIHENQLNIFH